MSNGRGASRLVVLSAPQTQVRGGLALLVCGTIGSLESSVTWARIKDIAGRKAMMIASCCPTADARRTRTPKDSRAASWGQANSQCHGSMTTPEMQIMGIIRCLVARRCEDLRGGHCSILMARIIRTALLRTWYGSSTPTLRHLWTTRPSHDCHASQMVCRAVRVTYVRILLTVNTG